jgi:hypothetical protein
MANVESVIRMLKQEQARLSKQLQGISAALAAFGTAYRNSANTRTISAAGRARIAAAQRARWAKAKGKQAKVNVVTMPKKRALSPAARRKIAAAQRARWAKVRAGQKSA